MDASFLRNRWKAAALYGCFLLGCLFVHKTLQVEVPTGAYDYILTMSAALQSLGFALLVFETKSGVGEGLSEKALWAFLVAHVTRLSTTFWSGAYTPEDNTADVYMYQVLESAGVLFVIYKLRSLKFSRTLHDMASMERWSLLLAIFLASLVLAYFTRGIGHESLWVNISWMFSVWLEAFALVPQAHLLCTKTASFVEEAAIHFAALTLLASLAFGGFWGLLARDRYAEFEAAGEHGFFIGILVAAAIRVALCSVYFCLFMRSAQAYKGAMTSSVRGEYELCKEKNLDWDEF